MSRIKKDKKLPQINAHRAFSIVEIAIALAVIGLLMAGIMNGAGLINQARLGAARSLVADSPVPKIDDLVIWLESSGKNSFAIGSGTSFTNLPLATNGQAIGVWNNINPQISPALRENLAQAATASQPTFILNAINALPALRFSGSQFLQNNKLLMNRTGLSVFVVARRRAVVANSSIVNGRDITTSSNTDDNSTNSLVAFFEDTGTTIASRRNTTSLSSATHLGNNVPFIAATIFNGATNIFYLNGVASSSVASTASFFIHQLMLGCRIGTSGAAQTCYNGDLAEVIVYKRGLNNAEIDLIKAYLSKKYKITVS